MQRLVAILVGVAVSLAGIGLAAAERRQEKFRASLVEATRVDMGVTLHVVRQSADGAKVRRPTPENTVRTHHVGGMVQIGGVPEGWNVATMGEPPRAFYCGPSARPVVWMCSEAQEPLILHADGAPKWTLIQGSEGAGKSVTLVMWTALRVLEHVGRDATGAITVPTTPRFRAVKKEARRLWPATWYRWRERDRAFAFHAGPTVQVVSAVQRSEESGSPLQGDSLDWCASDELQDHFSLEADIMSRGRGSDRYLRLCTSTSKDYSEWRDYRAIVAASPLWTFVRMLGMASPFVDRSFWHEYRASGTVTEREWRRRILAEDVGPERQVYFNWRRTFDNGRPANLTRIPAGAVDITRDVLKAWGGAAILVGHDPGKRQHVSEFLKAYRLPGQKDPLPRWFVVDEVTTIESTTGAHVGAVRDRLRTRWGCNLLDRHGKPDPDSPVALVRVDPHTRSGDDHPDASVYTTWRAAGLMTLAAGYQPGTSKPQVIKRDARINLVNTLLAATAAVGEIRRLFVALDEAGHPVAPQLVKALETMERNEAGKAEAEKKDADDLSHWPAALGYALWQVESGRVHKLLEEAA